MLHLAESVAVSLIGLAMVAFLLGHYPIHRTLRWKGTDDGRDTVSTTGVKIGG